MISLGHLIGIAIAGMIITLVVATWFNAVDMGELCKQNGYEWVNSLFASNVDGVLYAKCIDRSMVNGTFIVRYGYVAWER